MINPGQSPKKSASAVDFRRSMHEFKDEPTPAKLKTILGVQRERMEKWGRPAGRFMEFYIEALGLDFDNVAFANVAWCATKGNQYPATVLNRCFTQHAGPLFRLLRPTVVLASGSRTHRFSNEIASMVPGTRVIKMLHYAHRGGRAIEAGELARIGKELEDMREAASADR